jgi:hypothetical protein
MLSVFIVLAYSTALFLRLENNHRDKKAMTNPEYAAGEMNFDEMSGLRYEACHLADDDYLLTSKTQRSNGHPEQTFPLFGMIARRIELNVWQAQAGPQIYVCMRGTWDLMERPIDKAAK